METVVSIVAAHREGVAGPEATVARAYARIRAHGDPAVFISLRNEEEAVAEARALAARDPQSLPLYGVPVAIKDNIDVESLETDDHDPCKAETEPEAREDRREACRQAHAKELHGALTAEYTGCLEQLRIDRAHAKNAVVTKSVDFGMFGIAAATLGAAAGEPIVVIASACNRGMGVVAKKDSPISSIKDLKGRHEATCSDRAGAGERRGNRSHG